MIDIVFPKNNEALFISMAKKLGYTKLCFVYDAKTFQLVKRLKDDTIEICYGIIGIDKKRLSGCDLTFGSTNARGLIENVDYIFGVEEEEDYIQQRGGGLNDGLFKLMKDRKTGYVFFLADILNSQDKSGFLGRVMQNVTLCEKYGVDVLLFSGAVNPFQMRSSHDLESFSKIVGVENLRERCKKLEKKIDENRANLIERK